MSVTKLVSRIKKAQAMLELFINALSLLIWKMT